MDIRRVHDSNLRNASSDKTQARPYKDSRCYRVEKDKNTCVQLFESGLKFAIYRG